MSHRVTTVGPTPFRLIAVVNRGLGAEEDPSAGPSGGPGGIDPAESTGRWFRSARRTVEPGEVLPWEQQPRPAVVVQVSGGTIRVEPGDGARAELQGPGDFSVLLADEEYRILNTGSSPVTLVFVEVR